MLAFRDSILLSMTLFGLQLRQRFFELQKVGSQDGQELNIVEKLLRIRIHDFDNNLNQVNQLQTIHIYHNENIIDRSHLTYAIRCF